MKVTNVREPALLTTAEAGRLLGISPKTVVRLAQSGELPAVRLGPHGRWRLIAAHVHRLVQSQPVTSKYGIRESVPSIRDEGDAA